MFIPLIFSTSVIIGLHYFGKAEAVYQWMVKQPIQYYIWLVLFLVIVQSIIYIYRKVFPYIQGLYRGLSRITSRIDNLSNTIEKSSKEDHNSPFKNGQKRSFSNKSTSTTPLIKSRVNNDGRKKLQRLLDSRRVKGLFAAIVESGAMVSLEPTFKLESRDSIFATKEEAQKYIDAQPGNKSRIIRFHKKNYEVHVLTSGSVSDLISGFGWRIIAACFPHKVKFTARMRLLKLFHGYIFRMYKTNGAIQVVKYLKTSQLALQKAIAGDKVDNLRKLDKGVVRSKLTSSGLPVIIPSRDRKLILSSNMNASVIRFWLTLFSIYRVISIPGTLKLSTIVSPSSATTDFAKVAQQFQSFLRDSSVATMFNKSIMYRAGDLLFLEAASATHKVAWTGLLTDPSLLDSLGLGGYARNLLTLMRQPELWNLYSSLVSLFPSKGGDPKGEAILGKGVYSDSKITDPEGGFAGKLSIKEEAAGKMRVFAMVDVWSQTILKPMEKMLASFLKNLPNDGVYGQVSSEKRARSKSLLVGRSFGYDLSAATDRLPLSLQAMILDNILPQLGENWALFLTKREYFMYLPHSTSKEIAATPNTIRAKAPNSYDAGGVDLPLYYNQKSKPWLALTYAVGQPMGALSSFAMLAVCHHLLAQFCYRLAYGVPMNLPFTKDTWYTNYECTGDDIVIFDDLVAKKYLEIMNILGVPINTTKSVVATLPAVEYLKVTSLKGHNVSAISWKMFMSGNSLMGRANIIDFLLQRGIATHHINSWVERVARLHLYSKESNLTPTLLALWSMLANRQVIPVEEVLKALISGKDKVFRFAKAILLNADVNKIKLALPKLYLEGKAHLETSKLTEIIWSFEHTWFKITMWKPLAVFQARADIQKDGEDLAKSLFLFMHPEGSKLGEDFWARSLTGEFILPAEGQMTLDDPESLILNDMLAVFIAFKKYVCEKLSRIGTPLLEERGQIDSPLPLLVTQNKELERYNEIKELLIRAQDKLDPEKEVTPVRAIKPTELSVIKLIRKMGNRPLFTTAASLW